MRPDIVVTAVADGAVDNRTFLETLSPAAAAIGFFHACEHPRTWRTRRWRADWYDRWRRALRGDPKGVAKVIRAIRYLRDTAKYGQDVIERELECFGKNRRRMRYRWMKEQGFPIGSGVVEAASKTLVAQRMKRSGMRWSIVGG